MLPILNTVLAAAAGQTVMWDCKVLTAATKILLPTNSIVQGFGSSISQLIGGWTLVAGGSTDAYVENSTTGPGNAGIRWFDVQIVGQNTAGNNPGGVAGGPWGSATAPVVGMNFANCSDIKVRARAYQVPGISFAFDSCYDADIDVEQWMSGRDGLHIQYIGGEMHDLRIRTRAYYVGDDALAIFSSSSGGPFNGTTVTVSTTAGSMAIVAAAAASWVSGQNICITGAGDGGGSMPLEATITVTDSTHAVLSTPAVTTQAAATSWYNFYRPYNINVESVQIYGQSQVYANGAGRGIIVTGCDVTFGEVTIDSTYSSGMRLACDFTTTAMWCKITGGNINILNAGQVGSSSQPQEGITMAGVLRATLTSVNIESAYNEAFHIYLADRISIGTLTIEASGLAAGAGTGFGLDLDGTSGSGTYSVNRVELASLNVDGCGGNGLHVNSVKRVKIAAVSITNNGVNAGSTAAAWGVQLTGDANTSLLISSGSITDTRPNGSQTQLGNIIVNTGGAPNLFLSKLDAHGNVNADISPAGAIVSRHGVVCSVGTTQTQQQYNYDQDPAGAKHFSSLTTPAGNISAPIGSTYKQTDGTSGTTFWIKESGTGTSGWTSI